MNIIENKILAMVKPESKTIIENSLSPISDFIILEADSEKSFFELIYKHIFILVIIDETLPDVDIYKIGTMLVSHKATHNTPLLIISKTINSEKFLTDFKNLQIDYIQKPFSEHLILAKIKIFFDLFEQKNAVDQSIEELDKVYQQIVAQHEFDAAKEDSQRELINISSIVANQMQQTIQNLQGNIYQIFNTKGISPKTRASITSIKTSTERLLQISKKLSCLPSKTNQNLTKTALSLNTHRICKILYVENSDDDFNIFSHLMTSVLQCDPIQAKTIGHGIELIADYTFDLIFITHNLPDGTGIDLISRLNQLRVDITVIFTVNKVDYHLGAKALAKGASAILAKEDISSKTILSIIDNTLTKTKLSRQIENARNRITLISKKDYLTRLYNRRCFEQDAESEILRAKRYKTDLSILIVDFDKFKTINQNHGYHTGDVILRTSAALIQSMVRDSDMVCRFGGEEFGIVLSNTDVNGARILAKRIRKIIGEHEFEKDSNILKLTVSIGITSYNPKIDTDSGILIKRALDALASTAKEGGNQIKTILN